MIREIKADINRHRSAGVRTVDYVLNPAVWAIVWYRFGYWLYHTRMPSLIGWPLKFVYRVGYVLEECTLAMCISAQTQIGEGLLIGHVGEVHFHPEAVIGRNCDISPRVTIGDSAAAKRGAPRLGDNVYVGTGAVIVGPIMIGDGARIAANSLVISNVPAGVTVMGVPARAVLSVPAAKLLPVLAMKAQHAG